MAQGRSRQRLAVHRRSFGRVRWRGWPRCRRTPRARSAPGRRGRRPAAPWPRPRGRRRRRAPRRSPGAGAAGPAPRRGSASSVRSPSSSSSSRASSGPAVARASSTGSVGTPSRRSVPGVLPETPASEATSRMSSESWNAVPTISPYFVSACCTSGVRAAEHRAVARRGRDQRAGLAGHHVEVVLQGVLVGAGLEGLEDLALDQPGEGLRLDAYGVGARARRSARRTSRTGSRR